MLNKRLKFNDYHIYYINNSRFVKIYERIFLSIFPSRLKRMDFKYDNLNDENGTNYGFYRIDEDISDILKTISFEKYLHKDLIQSHEKTFVIGFIKKNLLETWPGYDSGTLRNFLLMIKSINSHTQSLGVNTGNVYFIINRRLWIDELTIFALKFHISLISITPPLQKFFRSFLDFCRDNKYILLCKNFP